ncbi:DUF2254 domain-containing protein [Halomicroarcula sp. F28]|nr:DUF2254 domain-containing protein [Halomicroarcula salinisoli]
MTVVLGTVTALLNPHADIATIRSLLTTLATAEASVLAIVFSVTVVALQLVVNRYTARLTSLFIDDPLFRTTFGLFVIAIAVNLVAVYLLPVLSNQALNATVGIALGFAIVATVALYRFIRLMIERSSPEELITVTLDRELAPAHYLPDTTDAFVQLEPHPIRPLYHIITRAVESGEYNAAAKGIEGLKKALTETFDYAETHRDSSSEFADVVAEEVLTDYFPPIIEQLYEHEQYELVKSTIETVVTIGETGFDYGFDGVAESAAEGLGDAFGGAPLVWEGNRIRHSCREALVTLIKRAASQADYAAYSGIFHQLNHQMKVLLRRRPPREVTEHLILDYYVRESVEIFETLIERYQAANATEDINWISPTDKRQWTLPSEAEPLRDFWRDYAKLTTTLLQYRLSEDEYPIAAGNMRDGWVRIAETAAQDGLPGLATLCCMSILQLAYCLDQIEEERSGLLVNSLANLRIDYDPEIVDDAFARFQSGERPEGASISIGFSHSQSENQDRHFVEKLLHRSPEQLTFDEWLVDFQTAVKERTDTQRENAE